MLPTPQIATFLSHPDPDLRLFAAGVLSDCCDPSPVTRREFEQAIDAVPRTERSRPLMKLHCLPPGPDSATWLIGRLSRPDVRADDEVDLTEAALALDPIDIQAVADAIEANPRRHQVRRQLTAALDLHRESSDDLWRRLMEHSDRASGRYYGQFDSRTPEIIARILARRAEPSIARLAHEVLERDRGANWHSTFATQLLGWMRWKPSAPLLVELLDGEASDYDSDVSHALSRIGDIEPMLSRIDHYDTQHEAFQWNACGVLSRIRHERSEPLIRQVIEIIDRSWDRLGNPQTLLAFSLFELVRLTPTSPETLELLRKEAIRERYDRSYDDLREQFWILATVVGHDFPEKEAWGLEHLQSQQRQNQRMRAMFGNPITVESKPMLARNDVSGSFLTEEEMEGAPLIATGVSRAVSRIGRNDPCPCGSGKKHKKCCLRIVQSTRDD